MQADVNACLKISNCNNTYPYRLARPVSNGAPSFKEIVVKVRHQVMEERTGTFGIHLDYLVVNEDNKLNHDDHDDRAAQWLTPNTCTC